MKRNVGSNSSALVASKVSRVVTRDRITPLSGKPYFTTILSKSQVQGPYQLTIPTTFYSHLPSAYIPVVLSYGNREWEMMYRGDRFIRRFDVGWKQFVNDNELKIGDGCVFELVDNENVRFEVRILSGEVPELFANCGRSCDIPIIIE